jgi:hypothetical protein
MKVIVCGSHKSCNAAFIIRSLDKFHEKTPISELMHGGAANTDTIAGEWAAAKGIIRYCCKANWKEHGKAAGPIRNARMLEWMPDKIIAFPGGHGTENMKKIARKAGIEVIESL